MNSNKIPMKSRVFMAQIQISDEFSPSLRPGSPADFPEALPPGGHGQRLLGGWDGPGSCSWGDEGETRWGGGELNFEQVDSGGCSFWGDLTWPLGFTNVSFAFVCHFHPPFSQLYRIPGMLSMYEYVEFPSTGGCFLWDVEKVNVFEETIRNLRISTATSATNLGVAWNSLPDSTLNLLDG